MYSSVDGHFDSFHFLANMNNVAVDVRVQAFHFSWVDTLEWNLGVIKKIFL